jgi:uncharacterized protein YggT (Ycf19 family)
MQPVVTNPPVVDPNAPISPADRVARIVYLVFGVLEALLVIRFILKLLAANPDAGFSNLIYSITQPFLVLFQGVFPDAFTRGSVLEVSTLLAILVYALLAWAIASVVRILGRRQNPGAPVA